MKTLNRISRWGITGLLSLSLLAGCSPGDPPQQQAAAPPPPTSLPPADLVIKGGMLMDMATDTADPVPIKGIVVRNGLIDTIIPRDSSEPLPAAHETIDAGSGYVIPGLIDAHVHFRPWLPDAGIWRRNSLYYGITTLFDTGPCGDTCVATGQDANEWIAEYKALMNESAFSQGPTLYMTGRRIDGPDGSHPLAQKVRDRQEIADYLDLLVNMGVDGVKVESTLPADLRAMVMEEANARGLPVVGHSKDARESINAGMKFIEHMWPITSSLLTDDPGEPLSSPSHDYLMDLEQADGLIEIMVNSGVYLNPTMLGRYGYFSDSLANGLAVDRQSFGFNGLFADVPADKQQAVLDWWTRADDMDPAEMGLLKQGAAKVRNFIRRLTEAGGKVLAATDSGQEKIPGIALHREMKLLADAGITPYRVLLGATRWPAEMTYKDDIIGTITAGKHADIVVLDANPLDSIDNTSAIRYVVRHGTVVRAPDDCSVIIPPVSMSCK